MRYIFLLLALMSVAESKTLDSLLFEIGVNASYGFNFQSTEISGLPGVPSCCPEEFSGLGSGINLGLTGYYPLDRKISVGLNLGYSTLSGELSKNEITTVDISDGTFAEATINHSIENTITSFSIQPMVSYDLDKNARAFLAPGIDILNKAEYSQVETLLSPNDITYDNGTITRFESEGNIPQTNSIIPVVSAGLMYSFPLNEKKDLLASPFVSFSYSFGSLLKADNWKVNSLKLGIELRKGMLKSSSTTQIKESDTLKIDNNSEPKITGLINIDIKGETIAKNTSKNKSKSVQYNSILSYIFFDKNESEIPKRYKKNISESDSTIPKENRSNNLESYYNVLNILGKRFLENEDSKIIITGCNSNYGKEKNNKKLSRERAKSVEEYFIKNWGIEKSRIEIKTRNLPGIPSKADSEYGRAENRRVEIRSSNDEISKINKSIISKSNINKYLKFSIKPNINSEYPIKNWVLSVKQNGNILKRFFGNGNFQTIKWKKQLDSLSTEELKFKLNIIDSSGYEKTITKSINRKNNEFSKINWRENKVNTPRVESYNLLLFGYNKTELSKTGNSTLNQIKNKINNEGYIVESVKGYSDIIGDDEYNLKLSKQRAVSVTEWLEIDKSKAIGMGTMNNNKYNNSLPEGRFYSRSVIITLKRVQ